MRRSAHVPASLVAALAAAMLTGCAAPSETRRCLDESGNVLPDSYCATGARGGVYGGRRFFGVPRFGYGGSLRGGRVEGSHATPSRSTIQRGGFGSSGRSGGGFFGG